MSKLEFKELRVLVVGGKQASVQVLRTVFSLIGIRQIVVAPDSRWAIDQLRAHKFSAIFCDALAEPVDGASFAVAARRTEGLFDPMTPLFVIYSEARRRQVEFARDSGATDVLARPIAAATIERKLRQALWQPRPFIAAPGFFGPDRRTARSNAWSGEERRKRTARKTKVTTTAI